MLSRCSVLKKRLENIYIFGSNVLGGVGLRLEKVLDWGTRTPKSWLGFHGAGMRIEGTRGMLRTVKLNSTMLGHTDSEGRAIEFSRGSGAGNLLDSTSCMCYNSCWCMWSQMACFTQRSVESRCTWAWSRNCCLGNLSCPLPLPRTLIIAPSELGTRGCGGHRDGRSVTIVRG